ncbi:hypothetical protein [Streptomyces cinereoruber]
MPAPRTTGATFRRLTDQEVLRTDDPVPAAHHFTRLLLWHP